MDRNESNELSPNTQHAYGNESRNDYTPATSSQSRSYFESNVRPHESNNASQAQSKARPGFRDYRESVVFSDEGTSPLGMCLDVQDLCGY